MTKVSNSAKQSTTGKRAAIVLNELEEIFAERKQDLIDCLVAERYQWVHRAEEDFQVARAILNECRAVLTAAQSGTAVSELIEHQTQQLVRYGYSQLDPWRLTALQRSIGILQNLESDQ